MRELGITAGLVDAGTKDAPADVRRDGIVAGVGVEAAVMYGAFGLFGEYSHWTPAGWLATSHSPDSVNLYGGGVRWQTRVSRDWCGLLFADVGLGGGRWHEKPSDAVTGHGLMLGLGVLIPVGSVYVRPQFRIYEGPQAGAAGYRIGIGVRF